MQFFFFDSRKLIPAKISAFKVIGSILINILKGSILLPNDDSYNKLKTHTNKDFFTIESMTLSNEVNQMFELNNLKQCVISKIKFKKFFSFLNSLYYSQVM